MKTKEWRFDSDYNRITAIEPGNCRITIVENIFGIDENDWLENGELIAMAPMMAEIVNRAEKLVNRLHNEAVFNPNITEVVELYNALFDIGRCKE